MVSLRLLHLSDIHFQKPFCLKKSLDSEATIRDLLIQDVLRIVEADEIPINAVLVTGDIAYHGDSEEYIVAWEWFDDLCAQIRCLPESVYVVPGNHDVDREACSHIMVDAVRKQVMAAEGEDRHQRLHLTTQNAEAANHLLKPMEAYNKFAARYGCEIILPDWPFWQDDLPISDGYTLRINGLTSTYFCGPNDDREKDLMLGRFQTAFRIEDGIIHLAMMHHPPHWLWDQDAVEDAFANYTALSLVGHRHRQRWTPGATSVTFAAGAVNPKRNEGNWEPGYNVIDLSIIEDDARGLLDVSARLQIWQSSPDRFVAKVDQMGNDVFTHKISLAVKPMSAPTYTPEVTAPAQPQEMAAMSTPSSRSIVYSFWNLTPSQRRKIANRLALLNEGELALPEPQRYRRAFENAARRSITDQLVQEIERVGQDV